MDDKSGVSPVSIDDENLQLGRACSLMFKDRWQKWERDEHNAKSLPEKRGNVQRV